MNATQKWMPQHWRSGCWVSAHTRNNGVKVSRHWRSGSQVQGHYCAVGQQDQPPPRHHPQDPGGPPRRRTLWPRSPRVGQPDQQDNPTLAIILPPGLNNAAVALALAETGQYTIWPRHPAEPEPWAKARLTSVTWTDPQQEQHWAGELTTGTDSVILPEQVHRITLEINITPPQGPERSFQVDTGVFFNADRTITTVPGSSLSPDEAIRLLHRLEQHRPAQHHREADRTVRRNNRVRELLGAANPERAVQQAMAETIRTIPPPALSISRPLTIPCPGTGYRITVEPDPLQNPAAQTDTPREKTESPAAAGVNGQTNPHPESLHHEDHLP